MNDIVRGRFAPSPSGRMHMGNMLSALLGWLSARSQGGEFLLRLENLDERCADSRNANQIFEDLTWMGLDWDGPVLYQSDHLESYADALCLLESRAHVYPCFCSRADVHAASAPHASDGTPVYAGTCRNLTQDQRRARALSRSVPPALRIEVPERTYMFEDAHCGPCEQRLAEECGDFILQRSDGVFAYQLVCVVDDALSGITEVVRGSDLLLSTPRQLFLQELLGYDTPSYAHHPLLTDAQGRRLSKRDRDCDMGQIRASKATPEQFVGQLAYMAGLLDTPIPLRAEELVPVFSWSDVVQTDVAVDSGEWCWRRGENHANRLL